MAECTPIGAKNRYFDNASEEPAYTEAQNVAFILEEHARGFRELSDDVRQSLLTRVTPQDLEWARALPTCTD